MSWIFGVIDFNNRLDSSQYKNLHKNSLFTTTNENFYLAAGGNSDTCFCDRSDEKNGWVVCGIGIKRSDNKFQLWNKDGWKNLFRQNHITLNELDGHFAGIRWINNKVELYTDKLGLREIFFTKTEQQVIFSTRIEWIIKFLNAEIDFREFGSRWLLYNQISGRSFIKNVTRIVGGMKATISNHSIEIENNNWLPSFNQHYEEIDYIDIISKIISIESSHQNIQLSLSGGLDSRFLLSFLINPLTINLSTYTFGNPHHPDNRIADRITKEIGIDHENIHKDLPGTETLINDLEKFGINLQVTNPISTYLPLRYYHLIDPKSLKIDGGFGGFWRDKFFFKLQIAGKKALLDKNVPNIMKYLRASKPAIFNSETLKMMTESSQEQIDESLSELPDANEIGSKNWIDLFSVRTRIKNYYAPEQARIDDYVVSYMPLIQSSLLELLFRSKPDLKPNSKFFRKVTKENCNVLSRFPLVKGNTIHPYALSPLQGQAWCAGKQKLGFDYRDTDRIKLWNKLKNFVMEIVESPDVKSFEHYDYASIRKLVQDFYKGNTKLAYDFDWWLSFEFFRRQLKG